MTPISQEPDGPFLICIGASVRAMAFSAIRAGFRPICFDYFADVDLQRAVRYCGTTVTKITGYNDATLRLIDKLSSDIPLMYGGAVENQPSFLDQLDNSRPVWGITGECLRLCRDPWEVQRIVGESGVPPLEIRSEVENRVGKDWIWKPFASGGGIDINNPTCGKPGYYQRAVCGYSTFSILCVRDRTHGLKWMGIARNSAASFSVNRPVRFADDGPFEQRRDWQLWQTAEAIGRAFDLCGYFGVDLIEDDIHGGFRVLEVNPRYTSTAELHDYVTGRGLLWTHAKVFHGHFGNPPSPFEPAANACKSVVFAPFRMTVNLTANGFEAPLHTAPKIADVPACGTVVERGEPIATIFLSSVSGLEVDRATSHFLNEYCVSVD